MTNNALHIPKSNTEAVGGVPIQNIINPNEAQIFEHMYITNSNSKSSSLPLDSKQFLKTQN